MDSVETGYYRDVVDIKKGTISYGALRVRGDVLTVDFVVNRASDGERVLVRRFGISK